MRKCFGASLALSVLCLLALGWVYAGTAEAASNGSANDFEQTCDINDPNCADRLQLLNSESAQRMLLPVVCNDAVFVRSNGGSDDDDNDDHHLAPTPGPTQEPRPSRPCHRLVAARFWNT